MTWNLPLVYARRLRLQRRKPSLTHITPSPYLYSQRGEGHGLAQSKVLREQWLDVYDNYEGGFKLGFPYVTLLGSRYKMYGKCPTCAGPVLLRDVEQEVQRSNIPFCPSCRKQFTRSVFNYNDRGNLDYNPRFETGGVEMAWNDPLPSEATFDMNRHSPDPAGNSSGVRQY